MAKLTVEDMSMAQADPKLQGISDDLKDPAKFEEIQHKILIASKVDHKHKKISVWLKCKRCQKALERRRKVLAEYGFEDYEQYTKWRKVMDIIINKKDIDLG